MKTSMEELELKCRGCLNEIDLENAEPLSDPVVHNLYKQCVRQKISKNGNLPEYICCDCHSFCVSWSNFKQKCNINETFLKLLLKRQLKTVSCDQPSSIETPLKLCPSQEEIFNPFEIHPLHCDDNYLDCRSCGEIFPSNEFFQHSCIVVEEQIPADDVKPKVEEIEMESDNEFDDFMPGEGFADGSECDSSDEDIKTLSKKKGLTINARRYACKQCDIRFRRPVVLRKHELSHVIVKDPKCFKCEISFSNVLALEEHCTVMHNIDIVRNYNCLYCDGKYSTYAILIKHLYTHEEALEVLPNNKHQCPKCDDYKSSEKILNRHILTCTPFSHKCNVCGDVCKNATHLKTHMRIHRNKDDQEFLCTTCGKVYKSKTALRNHFSTHKDRTDKCQICHRVFSGPVRLSVHMQRVHSNKDRVQCQFCPLDFRDAYSMRAHLAQHEEKPFKCSICNHGFKFKLSFERHQAKCYPGKKVFPTKKRAVDKERVRCPCCFNGFPTLKLLRKHLEDTHRNEGIDIETAFNSIKVFECAECKKKFATVKNLKDHMITHSTLKPFECEVCNKPFRDTTLLTYHMLTHKKRETFTSIL